MGSAIGSLSYVTVQEMLKKAYNRMTIISFSLGFHWLFYHKNVYEFACSSLNSTPAAKQVYCFKIPLKTAAALTICFGYGIFHFPFL